MSKKPQDFAAKAAMAKSRVTIARALRHRLGLGLRASRDGADTVLHWLWSEGLVIAPYSELKAAREFSARAMDEKRRERPDVH